MICEVVGFEFQGVLGNFSWRVSWESNGVVADAERVCS